MSKELNNCPFCGYEAGVIRNSNIKIFCTNNTKSCPIKVTEWYSDENLAISIWNNRKQLERNNLG